jgi:hypothetical protein
VAQAKWHEVYTSFAFPLHQLMPGLLPAHCQTHATGFNTGWRCLRLAASSVDNSSSPASRLKLVESRLLAQSGDGLVNSVVRRSAMDVAPKFSVYFANLHLGVTYD